IASGFVGAGSAGRRALVVTISVARGLTSETPSASAAFRVSAAAGLGGGGGGGGGGCAGGGGSSRARSRRQGSAAPGTSRSSGRAHGCRETRARKRGQLRRSRGRRSRGGGPRSGWLG